MIGCGIQGPRTDLDNLKAGEETQIFNGRDLSGWRIVKEIFFDRPGEVKVDKGSLVLGEGKELTGVAWTGKVLRDGFEVSFKARRVKGEDFFCGFTFPIRKGDASLILGGWGGTVVGLTAIDSYSAAENDTTQAIEFKLGRWYDVRVRVAEGYVRVFLDEKKIIDHEIEGHKFEVWPQMEEARPMSFSTYSTVGEFRDIVYRRVE
jgi:hypothetical protein